MAYHSEIRSLKYMPVGYGALNTETGTSTTRIRIFDDRLPRYLYAAALLPDWMVLVAYCPKYFSFMTRM